MAITRQPTSKVRYILRAATFAILNVSFVARISGESVGESTRPSNSLIAFADAPDQRTGPQGTQYAQIYTITPDGGNRRQLTTGKPGNFFPAWSPSGEQLAFVSIRNQKPEIWIVDSNGKNERFITSGLLPAWSPDGRKLAFTRPDAKGRGRIWIIGVDGRGERQLTSEGFNHCPTWSPKGDKIAYWSGDARGFGQIWVMNADGSYQRVLVSDVRVIPMRTSWQPVFSVEPSNKTDSGDGK